METILVVLGFRSVIYMGFAPQTFLGEGAVIMRFP